jgi:hypothetical protein
MQGQTPILLRISLAKTLYECCVQHGMETSPIWVLCAFFMIQIV